MRILLLFTLLLAQRPTDACSIMGSVQRLGTADPLPRARVLLTRIDGRLSDSVAVTADSNGQFSFSDIPSGHYRLFATHDGYVRSEFRQRKSSGIGVPLTLSAGEEMRNVVLNLTPTGTITGRVVDSGGEPVRSVSMQALTATYSDGERILTPVFETQTNDFGEYRLHTLAPGIYWIRAVPRTGNMRIENGEIVGWNTDLILREGQFVAPAAFTSTSLFPAFFPGTTTLSSARSLEIRAGEVLRADDLVLGMGQGARIRGQTINGVTNQPVAADSLSLLRNANDGSEEMARNATPDPLLSSRSAASSFEFTRVPPGSYVLTARSGTMNARFPVEVRDDIDDVRIVLRPTATVTGRIRLEGNGITASELGTLGIRLEGTEITPRTTPSCDRTCGVYLVATARAKPAQDLSFTMTGVGSGLYRVGLYGAQARTYVKAVRVGALQTAAPVIRVGGNATETIEVVLGTASGTMETTVYDENKKPSPAVMVVLVPESDTKDFDRYRTGITGPDGTLRLEEIVPGSYKVYAWEDIQKNAWQNAEILQSYGDRGTLLRIDESGVKHIDLQVIH